jgi:hypothetical protein
MEYEKDSAYSAHIFGNINTTESFNKKICEDV